MATKRLRFMSPAFDVGRGSGRQTGHQGKRNSALPLTLPHNHSLIGAHGQACAFLFRGGRGIDDTKPNPVGLEAGF